jgi:HK97 family phage major capsid protein
MQYIKGLVAERDALATQIMSMAEAAGSEDRSLSESENASIDTMKGTIDRLDNEIRRWSGVQKAVANFAEVEDQAASQRAEREAEAAVPEFRTIGEAWVESDAYRQYMQTPKGNSASISYETRALIKLDSFSGVVPKERIAPSAPPVQQTPLIDLISSLRVSQNSIEWVFFPAAAPLGTVTAEGAPKTEAAITPTIQTVTLDTIASWAQYSRQFGEDQPGLVDFLNASLARGIMDKREAAAAAALVAATIPVTTNTSGTLLQGIRRAVGTVQAAGYRPNAVALNPADYASLDLEVLGRTFNGPTVGSQFWGITPIPVGALASGTAYVGDFTTGMVELVRNDVQVYTTDSDITGAGSTAASAFRSNILTTLVEARTKPIVQRPEALTKVAGTVTLLAAEAASASKK